MSGSRTIGARICNVNVGRNNFDELRFEYFRDTTVALEAFKADRSIGATRTAPRTGPPPTISRR